MRGYLEDLKAGGRPMTDKELADHYKHLYSKLKKQKDDVVEYIKSYDVFKEFSFPLMKKWEENEVKSSIDYQFKESIKKELLRMLGEIDE